MAKILIVDAKPDMRTVRAKLFLPPGARGRAVRRMLTGTRKAVEERRGN